MHSLAAEVEKYWGYPVSELLPLSGGCIGSVYRAEARDGKRAVVKADHGGAARLDVEGQMLNYLAQHSQLPVPKVYCALPSLLVMEFIEGNSLFSASAEGHAAELLAELHAIAAPSFGFEADTLIGGLRQPNRWTERWIDFFRDQRLLYMGEEARRSGSLPAEVWKRIQTFASALEDFLEEPPQPALLHGDVWTTNVLAADDRITGFLDPAVYYGHPEIELAFITLFNTFGSRFFSRYEELRGIRPGFFERRRDIYNLYPLLVHTRLFGGGYATSVSNTLRQLGF
jgi:fructosamine-3-kinase